jgi:glycosyltransferase involved in cell wall biosynthesis
MQKATGIGGSEHHLLTLLSRLDHSRFSPYLLVLEDPARPCPGFLAKIAGASIPHGVVPIARHIDPALPARLVARFRRWRPDIVHTHLLHADLFGIPAARLARVPAVVSTKHNDDPFRHGVVGKVDWALSRMADRVIVISDHLRRFYRDVEGLPAEKLTRIHYGLEADGVPADGAAVRREFRLAPEAPLAGVVARLEEQKGHRYLLEAFVRVRAAVPGARLLIVGLGPLRPALERQAATLGLADAVIFTGFRDDVDRIMAALDLFVLPSLWEGFGLVLLEAMRAGKAIVATAVSAIPEIVADGHTGVLVPPSDADALAAAIVRLLRSPELRGMMGRAGRERLQAEFGVERMVEQTSEIYEIVSADRRRHAVR